MSIKHNTIHSDLKSTLKLVYEACGLDYSEPQAEAESVEYGAAKFNINGKSVIYRVAKITPTKTGLFVAIWKRNANGETAPYESTDDIDLLVISTRKDEHFGQFVFPKSVLIEKGILTGSKEGKRGMRVYPPWDKTNNKQAQQTQQWQLNYFLEIKKEAIDLSRVKKIYC